MQNGIGRKRNSSKKQNMRAWPYPRTILFVIYELAETRDISD